MIGALLGAVLGWPITRALDGWATESNLPWWAYLVGSAIGVVAVLFVMTFFVKVWRTAIWGNGWRGMKWLWSWRPVSARRHRNDLRALTSEVIERVDRAASEAAEKEADRAKARSEATKGLYVSFAEKDAEIAKLLANLKSRNPSTPQPSLPLPDPRWTIKHDMFDKTEYDFILFNHVPRSFAKEVRVEGVTDMNGYTEVEILDAGHFEDLSGEASGAFRARFGKNARVNGASIEVTWYNEHGAHLTEDIYVPGWEAPPPKANDVWNQPDPF